MNPRKVRHGRTRIKLFGIVFSGTYMYPDTERVMDVLRSSRPTTKAGFRSLAMFISYWRNFFPHLGHITAPWTSRLRKGASLNWDDECETSRRTLINILTEDIMLIYPDWEKQFVLQTDASESAIAAVCGQIYIGTNTDYSGR
eukprot:Nk52_evm1s871 gene=Nk52_evmTU1s871